MAIMFFFFFLSTFYLFFSNVISLELYSSYGLFSLNWYCYRVRVIRIYTRNFFFSTRTITSPVLPQCPLVIQGFSLNCISEEREKKVQLYICKPSNCLSEHKYSILNAVTYLFIISHVLKLRLFPFLLWTSEIKLYKCDV